MPDRDPDHEPSDGFTLIELMVVVLIIAILMAIAIPTFLSSRTQAQVKAVEANLRNAVTDEQTYFSQSSGGSYGDATNLVNYSVDPALTFTSSWPAAAPQIFVVPSSGSGTPTVLLGSTGQDGKSYWVYDAAGSLSFDVTSGTEPTTFPLPDTTWP